MRESHERAAIRLEKPVMNRMLHNQGMRPEVFVPGAGRANRHW